MEAEEARRRARRAWVRDHHPDAGGDPEVFAAGLAALDAAADAPGGSARPAPALERAARGAGRLVHGVVRAFREGLHGGDR